MIPVCATEQHGPHNPLGTDHLLAAAVARRVGDATGVPVLPVVPVGVSEHHRQFPGTLWVDPPVFREYLLGVALAVAEPGVVKRATHSLPARPAASSPIRATYRSDDLDIPILGQRPTG